MSQRQPLKTWPFLSHIFHISPRLGYDHVGGRIRTQGLTGKGLLSCLLELLVEVISSSLGDSGCSLLLATSWRSPSPPGSCSYSFLPYQNLDPSVPAPEQSSQWDELSYIKSELQIWPTHGERFILGVDATACLVGGHLNYVASLFFQSLLFFLLSLRTPPSFRSLSHLDSSASGK